MATYKVGTLKIADAVSGLIMQDCNISMEADEAQVKDENGNVAYLQYYNHRAVASINAVIPKGSAVPIIGATVEIKGVTLPSPAADGSMTSANVTISTDNTAGTAVEFVVTSSQITSSNSDVDKYTLTATRFLENGLGAVKTASA